MGAANRVVGAAAAGAVPQLDNDAHSYLPHAPDDNNGLGAATTSAASCTAPAATTVALSAATTTSSTQHRTLHNHSDDSLGTALEPATNSLQWTHQWQRRPPLWRKRVRCVFG